MTVTSQLTLTLQEASDASVIVDASSLRVLWYKESFCHLFGVPENDGSCSPLASFIRDTEAVKQFVSSLKKSDNKHSADVVHVQLSRNDCDYDVSVFAADYNGVSCFVLMFKIIVDTSHTNVIYPNDPEQVAVKLANRTRNEFIANISHEIRTPMNGVLGLVDLLSDTNLDELQKQYVSTIRQSAHLLLVVVNDLLDFSKIEANKFVLEHLRFSPRKIIEDVCDAHAFQIYEKGIKIVSLIEPDVPDNVLGDQVRFRQVLLNLVNNAVKFTAKGEVVIKCKTEASTGRALLKIAVSDTGIGVKPDLLNALFEPFTQADASTPRYFGSTGLGLSICKRLAALMNGTISVESEYGNGATFFFDVNLDLPDEKRAKSRDLSKYSLLIFDSHVTTRTSVRMQLKNTGINVDEAGSPDELERLVQQHDTDSNPYDIVLLDCDYPGFDTKRLESMTKNFLPFQRTKQVLTFPLGSSIRPNKLDIPQTCGFLTKPIRQQSLLDVITSMLDKGIEREREQVRNAVTEDSNREIREAERELSAGALQILLVEDVKINIIVATAMITAQGHKVEVAENGIEALELLRKNDYDMVFMDCQMPEMDGYECTEIVRSPGSGVRNPLIPIVAMTAHAMAGDREKCLECGMDDYITKPIDASNLAETIARWRGRN
ncbi:MAG: response regulator [Planctomycetaceae bacterium]|jgi:CheY-like chemotaxis protein/nitrogen-specific signal transduction histidine kinase|nr:response regulator [Planctomycetaceae bacterium]